MFNRDQTVLLVIDVQGKLCQLMDEKEKLIKNIHAVIKGAKIFGIPILWTEQVPEKVGNTIPEIAKLLKPLQPIEKVSFSCFPNRRFKESLSTLNRKQILVVGIEAHVCVYQTVADLIAQGYEVQVVCDAISARSSEHKRIALEQMKQLGAGWTSGEMIICELLKTSADVQFKEILQLIK